MASEAPSPLDQKILEHFAGLVVRDALEPDRDIVRTDGIPADADDPGGGCLDCAPDALPWLRDHREVSTT